MTADVRSPTPPAAPRALLRWLWQLVKDVVDEYRADGVGDLAASITFWTILSVPAAVLALVSALSSLESVAGASVAEDVEDEVQQFIADTLVDSETLSSAVDELFNSSNAGIATVATLVALFTLSRAFAGLIRALDTAYEVDEGRPWWYVRLVAIGLGVATVLIVATTATVLALLPELPLGAAVRFLTAPAVFVMLVLWAATLFHVGPNHRTPWRYDLPGAVFTAIGWIATSQGFALYVRFAGQGNQVQTSVGAILLALSLMYLLSIVLLIGAQLNDVIARRSGVVQEVAPVHTRAKRLRDRFRR
ncbi:MAG: YihY/virulence factor BrkB family protein [Ilumatobacter sp.]|uniref:YihY/virulence factor BrkB family protein n=1 Tax=Ilumatobacter sp. TaxID=1967498 RepID=UPI00260EC21A|nr:YihY/virulence factor BrkB family protein [Ilumatobacter sp.]MDJ0767924.1 YihY/virulence factor BrkB family protein [Ilumatobacter sp.]